MERCQLCQFFDFALNFRSDPHGRAVTVPAMDNAMSYSSEVFGEQKVTGSIKGNAITFGFTGTIEGTTVKVTYTGTVETVTMKGKVTIGDLGEGTFTAKKQ